MVQRFLCWLSGVPRGLPLAGLLVKLRLPRALGRSPPALLLCPAAFWVGQILLGPQREELSYPDILGEGNYPDILEEENGVTQKFSVSYF